MRSGTELSQHFSLEAPFWRSWEVTQWRQISNVWPYSPTHTKSTLVSVTDSSAELLWGSRGFDTLWAQGVGRYRTAQGREWLWLQGHLPPCVPKFNLVPLTTHPCGLARATFVVIVVIFLGSCVSEIILKSSSGEELLPCFLHTSLSIWALVQLSFWWNGIYLTF